MKEIEKTKSIDLINLQFDELKLKYAFYTFAHLKRRINDEKNKQKCKNLVITHREMCMKS